MTEGVGAESGGWEVTDVEGGGGGGGGGGRVVVEEESSLR